MNEEGYYFDDKISRSLLNRIVNSNNENLPRFVENALTKRERQIVELICTGKTNKEIANLLCLSVRTIEVHRNSINKKTNTKNVADLVVYAVKNGLYNI